MRPSPLLATAAALAVLGAVAGPAAAAGPAAPAAPAGAATSSVTLLELAAGGREVSAGTLELVSEALTSARVAKVVVTPLEADGTAYGAQTVTPASSPVTVPGASTDALVPALAGIASVSSPGFAVSASDRGAVSTRAQAGSLGGVSLLGLPLRLTGTLDVGSTVDDAGALGGKTLEVTSLALPSIADLLAALGLDVSLLPVDVLVELVSALDLSTATLEDLNAALDTAQAALQEQIDAATAAVQEQVDALDAAADARASARAAVAPARDAVTAAEQAATALLPDGLDLETALAGSPLVATVPGLAAALAAVTDARAALAEARSAVDVAEAAFEAVQALLDAAQQALAELLDTLSDEVDALVGALVAVLEGTPLVSLDRLRVTTSARATSAQAGGQAAEVVGGEVVGLRVLGTDVLDDVLGDTRLVLDPARLEAQLAPVRALVDELTGALSEVLSTVPGLPDLSVPAPEVGLLSRTTRTGVEGGFGVASTGVRGLSVSLPAITVPDLSVVPQLPSVPGGLLAQDGARQAPTTSEPVELSLATLRDGVQFRPGAAAVTATAPAAQATGPRTQDTRAVVATAPGRRLPSTGAPALLAGLGIALVGGALVVRRRAVAGDTTGERPAR